MHSKWNEIFLYGGRLFRFMLLQRAIESASGSTLREKTVYHRRKLWIAFAPRSRCCRLRAAGYQKRQCRRMNEKYHKGAGRTRLIDHGGSRGQRRHAFAVKRRCTRASSRAHPHGVPQERDKSAREKPSIRHTYLIARDTHTYAR